MRNEFLGLLIEQVTRFARMGTCVLEEMNLLLGRPFPVH